MSATDDLLSNNEAYAESFDSGDLPAQPAKKVAVLSCMDARVIPSRILGLEPGDAHIIKNAGGQVTDDVIRSLAISQRVLGTEEVIVIQHTDCRALEDDARESVEKLRSSASIPNKGSIRGFVYDVKTGKLSEVS